jgi:hypothetical protein
MEATPRAAPRSTVALALAVVGYRLLVDFGYRTVVAGPFEYYGFRSAPTVSAILVSWLFLLALLPLLVMVLRTETISAQVTGLLALISLVPTTTLIAHDPRYPAPYIVLIFVYWLLFLLACVFLPSIKPFRRPLRSELPHLVVLAVLSATVLFISWRHTGFRLHFGLFDVYDLRAEAREYQVATIVGYFATFADNILPILLAFYLRRKWFVVAALVVVVILFNFGISATKQVMFLLVFAVASVAVGEPARLNRKMLVALSAVIALAIVEQQVLGTVFVGNLSVFRVIVLPAHLHWVHYDFFQTNELLNLTQSALRFFFASPYEENVQFLLGEYYIGQFSARANNGLFSDGYMNFGAASVFFYPVLAVFLLKLMEGASKGLPSNVQFMIVMSLSFVLLGLPLPTAILSAGVGLLVVLLGTLPRRSRHLAVSVPA